MHKSMHMPKVYMKVCIEVCICQKYATSVPKKRQKHATSMTKVWIHTFGILLLYLFNALGPQWILGTLRRA